MMKTAASTKTPGGGAFADAVPNFSLGRANIGARFKAKYAQTAHPC
jgi:hypothetical protein